MDSSNDTTTLPQKATKLQIKDPKLSNNKESKPSAAQILASFIRIIILLALITNRVFTPGDNNNLFYNL